jgi:pyruvate dehydrogenase E1 component
VVRGTRHSGLIPEAERRCPVVTVLDGHPNPLSVPGTTFGPRTVALCVDRNGQPGSRRELYAHYQIGVAPIVKAVIEAAG